MSVGCLRDKTNPELSMKEEKQNVDIISLLIKSSKVLQQSNYDGMDELVCGYTAYTLFCTLLQTFFPLG